MGLVLAGDVGCGIGLLGKGYGEGRWSRLELGLPAGLCLSVVVERACGWSPTRLTVGDKQMPVGSGRAS